LKVLLDHNLPVQLANFIKGHEIFSARAMAWDALKNGDLLKAAENSNFDLLVTADKGIFHQQNNRLRRIALVVLGTNYRPSLERNIEPIQAAIDQASPGSFESVPIAGSARRFSRAVE
jgi:hypothetical protein